MFKAIFTAIAMMLTVLFCVCFMTMGEWLMVVVSIVVVLMIPLIMYDDGGLSK